MKPVSSFAIAAALLVGSAVILSPATEANAKKKEKEVAATSSSGRAFVLSKEARAALAALEKAIKAKDEAAYAAALPAATAASTTPDEKYVLAKFMFEHALGANDSAGQIVALEALLASGSVDATETPKIHQSLGILAFNASNWQRSHDEFAQVVQADPANVDAVVNLALTSIKLKKDAEALPLLRQAIAANKAANKPVPEAWYRNALQIAYASRNSDAVGLARETMNAYPTPENWRNALVVFRDSARADEIANLDTLRLMRASRAITTKTEYYSMAGAANDAGFPGEAKAVLDEAVAANLGKITDDTYRRIMPLVTARIPEDRAVLPSVETKAMAAPTGRLAFRTGDAYLSYGDYAKAAGLYRAAIGKGGDVDAPLANLHLGIALALSGDKAGAEAAFKAVTGPRAQLAGLWMDWLSRPAA